MPTLAEKLASQGFDKKHIKAVAIDIDGTLINEQGTCTHQTINAIKSLKESGREVFLVTGRGVNTALPYAESCQIPKFMINYNGGAIWNMQTSQADYEVLIDLEIARGVINLIRKHDLFTIAYSNHEFYYELENDACKSYLNRVSTPGHHQNFDTLNNFYKFLINEPRERIEIFYEELISTYGDKLTCLITTPGIHRSKDSSDFYPCVEIMPKNIDKGRTLKRLLDQFDISLDQVVAFGDDINDIGMLTTVTWGIAMGNAREQVKEVAPFETRSNNEHGVAYFIEEFIL